MEDFVLVAVDVKGRGVAVGRPVLHDRNPVGSFPAGNSHRHSRIQKPEIAKSGHCRVHMAVSNTNLRLSSPPPRRPPACDAPDTCRRSRSACTVARMSEAKSGAYLAARDPHFASLLRATRYRAAPSAAAMRALTSSHARVPGVTRSKWPAPGMSTSSIGVACFRCIARA